MSPNSRTSIIKSGKDVAIWAMALTSGVIAGAWTVASPTGAIVGLLYIGFLMYTWNASLVGASAFLIFWISVQNVVVPAIQAALGVDSVGLKAIIVLKELVAATVMLKMVLGGGFRQFVSFKADRFLAAFALIVAIYFMMPFPHGLGIGAKLVALRTVCIPVLFYLIGRIGARMDGDFASCVLRTQLGMTAFAVLFGLGERFLFGQSLWETLQIGKYWIEVKGLAPTMLINGLPGNFLFNPYSPDSIPRMASLFGDPLATGYQMFFAATMSFYLWRFPGSLVNRGGHGALTVLYLVGLGLTLTRAAILAFLLAILFAPSRSAVERRSRLLLMLAGGLMAFPFLKPIIQSTLSLSDSSTLGHLYALVRSISILPHVFGMGLGSQGAANAGAAGYVGGVGENMFLVIYAQLGAAGMIAFVLFMLWAFLSARELARTSGDPLPTAIAACSLGFAFTGLISEQLFTVTSTAAFWILLGSTITRGESSLPQLKNP